MSAGDFPPGSRPTPGEGGARQPPRLPDSPPCPFCDRTETRLVSPFGSQLSVATYWCDRCRTAFEHIKWAAAAPRPVP